MSLNDVENETLTRAGGLVASADIKKLSGDDDDWISTTCENTENSYYELKISNDGYYALVRWVGTTADNSKATDLVKPTRSSVIRQGNGVVNHVAISCKPAGGTKTALALTVNGHQLYHVTDTNGLRVRHMGFVVDRRKHGTLRVRVDNVAFKRI
jgi:hypothetical protein